MVVYEKVVRGDMALLVADGATQANAFIGFDDYVGLFGHHPSYCDRCRVDSLPGVAGGGAALGSTVPYYIVHLVRLLAELS